MISPEILFNLSVAALFLVNWSSARETLHNEQRILFNKWENFKNAHKKSYSNLDEEVERLAVFAENLQQIDEHNKLYDLGQVSYKKAVNHFADMTHEEFLQYLTRFKKPEEDSQKKVLRKEKFFENLSYENLPQQADWRPYNIVTPVKNQGECGSCWTFSATGALEGQHARKFGTLLSFSEQELIDCNTQSGNNGCRGGDMGPAFTYVSQNGITLEEDYPYEGKNLSCRRQNKPEAFRISGYMEIAAYNETEQQAVLATLGPIAVAIDASDWRFYSEGVFYDPYCGSVDDDLNHALLAVGYGTDNGQDYWLLKNSWGADWGEQGYIRTARNRGNHCGVATDSSLPVL